MEKVVILGADGMLGVALSEVLGASFQVMPLNRTELDITDVRMVEEWLRAEKPAWVINAVAVNAVDVIEKEVEAYERAKIVNGVAVGELARICHELQIPLIHFSTDYVFDGSDAQGYAEDAVPHPINKYGETKLLGETLLQEHTEQFYLIRTSRLFGKPGTSVNTKKSFVDVMIDLVEKQGKTELNVVNEEVSSPTYSVDLAYGVGLLMKQRVPWGIYHLTNQGSCTWYEFAEEIFKTKEIGLKLNRVSGSAFARPAMRPKNSVLLNNGLVSSKLPYFQRWEDAVKEYLQK